MIPENSRWTKADERLRNYFAAKAMQAIIQNMKGRPNVCEVSEFAYEMADEMLAARNDVISEEAMMQRLYGDDDDSIS